MSTRLDRCCDSTLINPTLLEFAPRSPFAPDITLIRTAPKPHLLETPETANRPDNSTALFWGAIPGPTTDGAAVYCAEAPF